MSIMKVLGELVKPKGMANHSYKPNLVLKAIFNLSLCLNLILLYLLFKSILENMVAPCNSSSKSFDLGMRCIYFMVMLLMVVQSIHIL